jgi:RimJ/RimL family protein N-acetyltransferase
VPALDLRQATVEDIPFIMETERRPGYERTVGRFEAHEHMVQLADRNWLYLVAGGKGFALLQGVDNRDGNLCMRRFIVAEPFRGIGTALLPAVINTIFEQTRTHRLWLHYVRGNEPAARLYARHGRHRTGGGPQARRHAFRPGQRIAPAP